MFVYCNNNALRVGRFNVGCNYGSAKRVIIIYLYNYVGSMDYFKTQVKVKTTHTAQCRHP